MKITIDKDLRGLFGSARDQDPRPTCLAFAASDAHAGARPGWAQLSVEWAYYHALQRDNARPHDGVRLGTMLATLREDGQPVEAVWPYIASCFTDIAGYCPPPTSNSSYRRDSTLLKASINEIVAHLNRDRPVLFTMSISRGFFCAPANGVVAVSEPLEPKRVHAVVAVGYGHADTDQFIIVRNSWGQGWGLNGHAWLSVDYLEPRLLGAATMGGEL